MHINLLPILIVTMTDMFRCLLVRTIPRLFQYINNINNGNMRGNGRRHPHHLSVMERLFVMLSDAVKSRWVDGVGALWVSTCGVR